MADLQDGSDGTRTRDLRRDRPHEEWLALVGSVSNKLVDRPRLQAFWLKVIVGTEYPEIWDMEPNGGQTAGNSQPERKT